MSTNGIDAVSGESVAVDGLYEDAGPPEETEQAAASSPQEVLDDKATAEKNGDEETEEFIPEEHLETLANILNESAKLHNISLHFKVDHDINRIVVTVKNNETEEVIRQVPPENLVHLSKSIGEMVGLLINATA